MTLSVTIYGFGSAFADVSEPNDVDLLIVHSGIDLASCEFAIACKRRLLECITCAHVTMLSASEASHFRFIPTARAFYLGIIRNLQLDEDLVAVLLKIHNHYPNISALLCRANT